jgi:hypothetical protein
VIAVSLIPAQYRMMSQFFPSCSPDLLIYSIPPKVSSEPNARRLHVPRHQLLMESQYPIYAPIATVSQQSHCGYCNCGHHCKRLNCRSKSTILARV